MSRGDTKPETWTVAQIALAVEAAAELDDTKQRLQLPQFQRSVVWKDEQREKLIDSIHQGLPIGSLLVSKKKSEDVYLLIDGLQRTKTVIEHQGQELELSNPAPEIVEQVAQELLGAGVSVNDLDAVGGAIKSWMRVTKTTLVGDGFSPQELAKQLSNSLNLKLDAEGLLELSGRVGTTLDRLKDGVSIGDYQVPVIVYQGSDSNLPEIFERMNSGGTPLSKYQIFAASWSQHGVLFDDDEIRDAIRDKYALYEALDFVVEGIREDGYQDSYNLFEFFFGLGKVLANEYKHLFPVRSSPDAEPESFVFSLGALVLGLPIGETADIPSSPLLARARDGNFAPRNIRAALEAGCRLVDEALGEVISLKLNQKNPTSKHPELLMVSLVASATLAQCDPFDDFKIAELIGADREGFKLAIRHHYLYDQIRRQWRGQTYSLATSRVWSSLPEFSGSSVSNQGQLSDHYRLTIERESWMAALDDWFLEYQINREQNERGNVREIDKLFLRYVYAYILTHAENHGTVFDIEHIFPVERLVALLEKDDSPGWPISCVSNLALLPLPVNRAKQSQTLSEHVADREAAGTPLGSDEVDRLEHYLLSTVEEASIPQVDGSDKLELDTYREFLRSRWSRLVSQLLDNLKV